MDGPGSTLVSDEGRTVRQVTSALVLQGVGRFLGFWEVPLGSMPGPGLPVYFGPRALDTDKGPELLCSGGLRLRPPCRFEESPKKDPADAARITEQ